MKSLYVRIVVNFILISLCSALIAFLFSNLYYQAKLKDFNEEKILETACEISALYEGGGQMPIDEYLGKIANLNFQLYLVDSEYRGKRFGDDFRSYGIEEKVVDSVLKGNTYHGISNFQSSLFVTGFFKDDVKNSIGVPIDVEGETRALFVRPNVEKQFGEMRIVFSLLLGITFILSVVLIMVLTTFIVRPIERLTVATRKIARGNYDLKLDMKRKDEIGELAKDFSSMAASLQKLDEMRQEFVSNVSHEIQSPLTSIQGFTKAIRSKTVSAEETDRYLEVIEKESGRLSSMSKQLLMLSSLDKQVKAVNKTSFRLDEQIREAVLLLEWEWSRKKIDLELELPQMIVEADKGLLFQVWVNLLANSIKFTEEGGKISLSAKVDGKTMVTVSDTGAGIHEEELPHIFDRFYMADKSRDRTKPGSGLGLSVVKKIIDLHGGAIHVESELEKGTLFTVELPR